MNNFLLDFLYPKKCVNCKKVGEYLCSNCQLDLKQGDLVCPTCERLSIGGITHPVCRRKYALDGLWSLGIYQNPLRISIQKLKYKWVTALAESLINITLEYWAKNPPILLDYIKKDRGNSWTIVPVPLHWTRKNWRGFNQSELLAKLLSKKLGLNHQDALIRTKKTKPQVKLKSYDRRMNIKNAFSLSPSMNNELITNNILLIDDVWTTGATLKECTYVLKKGGAKTVWALTLAR
ncbi:hypothetical protein A3E66_04725 [Candidatus Daviesbacteria bacterium RIFCSPHIGHO2_12_FULL_37_16]|uniref:Phosphoribosyltransferase n=3 Tax=Candidatus Daviesiibacteriota TaxID=1752718 RepID=A0A0G0F5U7_9BACT|nr:MAG: Phosphoribosyltransferase [Candidatus Daviesbacteria bacterium GW2011_GWB1_36_5]KKQ14168.1 MAG: Phosphoribosyltransferase [Candidatus Daviesbacteria bacterium GW2011_GWA1_36_8]OGE34883.1 MAG: hypothetical protein A3E66_04725 [Candidatus Daviesbacteria bacterium RIFCSPHIGHO2_12_FULL_37_16]